MAKKSNKRKNDGPAEKTKKEIVVKAREETPDSSAEEEDEVCIELLEDTEWNN